LHAGWEARLPPLPRALPCCRRRRCLRRHRSRRCRRWARSDLGCWKTPSARSHLGLFLLKGRSRLGPFCLACSHPLGNTVLFGPFATRIKAPFPLAPMRTQAHRHYYCAPHRPTRPTTPKVPKRHGKGTCNVRSGSAFTFTMSPFTVTMRPPRLYDTNALKTGQQVRKSFATFAPAQMALLAHWSQESRPRKPGDNTTSRRPTSCESVFLLIRTE
jgi:hypothetical protein